MSLLHLLPSKKLNLSRETFYSHLLNTFPDIEFLNFRTISLYGPFLTASDYKNSLEQDKSTKQELEGKLLINRYNWPLYFFPKEWQLTLLILANSPKPEVSILWVVDPSGLADKGGFMQFCVDKLGYYYLNVTELTSFGYATPSSRNKSHYLLDLSSKDDNSFNKVEFYFSLDSLKSPSAFLNRDGTKSNDMPSPQIIVISNSFPDISIVGPERSEGRCVSSQLTLGPYLNNICFFRIGTQTGKLYLMESLEYGCFLADYKNFVNSSKSSSSLTPSPSVGYVPSLNLVEQFGD